MAKRKEYTTKKGILSDYYETKVYDKGRSAKGVGKTKRESIERAYKHWREKYK